MRGQFTFMTYVFICLGITSTTYVHLLPTYTYSSVHFSPKKTWLFATSIIFSRTASFRLSQNSRNGHSTTYLLSFILQMSWPINYLIFFLGIFYILHSIMFGGKRKQVLLLLSGDKIWETCVKYNTNCVIFQHLKFEMQGDPKFSEDSSPR